MEHPDSFFAQFVRDFVSICNRTFRQMTGEDEEAPILCWSVADAIESTLAKEKVNMLETSNPLEVGFFLDKELRQNHLVRIIYDSSNGQHTHHLVAIGLEPDVYVVEYTSHDQVKIYAYPRTKFVKEMVEIAQGKRPDRFYHQYLINPIFTLISFSRYPLDVRTLSR